MFWLDASLRVSWVNRAWEELTGQPAESVVGLVCASHGPSSRGVNRPTSPQASSLHPRLSRTAAGTLTLFAPGRRRSTLAADRVLAIPRPEGSLARDSRAGARPERSAELAGFAGAPPPREPHGIARQAASILWPGVLDRHRARASATPGTGAPRRREQDARTHHGRAWNRQAAGGTCHSPVRRTARSAGRAHGLRGPSRRDSRPRTLRPCAADRTGGRIRIRRPCAFPATTETV